MLGPAQQSSQWPQLTGCAFSGVRAEQALGRSLWLSVSWKIFHIRWECFWLQTAEYLTTSSGISNL